MSALRQARGQGLERAEDRRGVEAELQSSPPGQRASSSQPETKAAELIPFGQPGDGGAAGEDVLRREPSSTSTASISLSSRASPRALLPCMPSKRTRPAKVFMTAARQAASQSSSLNIFRSFRAKKTPPAGPAALNLSFVLIFRLQTAGFGTLRNAGCRASQGRSLRHS